MSNLKEIVSDYIRPRLRRQLKRGWSTTKICDDARRAIWESCLEFSLSKSIEAQTAELIKQVNLIPQEEDFGDIEVCTRLTSDTPITGGYHRRSRADNHAISDLGRKASLMLGQVPWMLDEEMVDLQLDLVGEMKVEDRGKFISTRAMTEISAVGLAVCYGDHGNADGADRMYAETKGTFHPMWDKWSRARMVSPTSRKTDLAEHEAYIEREHGLTPGLVSDIIADPAAAFNNGISMMAIIQSMSWHRIASTGKTNIPVYMDAVASGYAHQLSDMRDPELFRRALPFRDDFIHPHMTLAQGLRKATNALRTLSLREVVPLSKFVFTPCMYGAGQTGLFNSATNKTTPEDLADGGDWADVGLPPLMKPIIGHLPNEEQAQLLYGLCRNWATIFRSKMPKVGLYIDYWMARWVAEAGPEGLWLTRPDGTPILCSRLKRDKDVTIEYRARWWEGGDRVEDCVNLFAPKLDEEGTALSAFVCQNRDAYTAAGGVVEANGLVLASIHDSWGFMLADEAEVQPCYTNWFNQAHVDDVMGTGRDQLIVNLMERMLR
jgi:hypothetical protein